ACTAIGVENGALAARIQFAPEGASATADEICGLVKAGIIRGISAGFDVVDAVPLDPTEGSRGGLRIIYSELLEVSFCAIPVDTGARVVARSFSCRNGALALLRSLPCVSETAIARAMAQLGKLADLRPPIMGLSQCERTQRYADEQRSRTMTAWAVEQARQAEEAVYSRQAALRELAGGNCADEAPPEDRRRLRPYRP